MVEYKKEFKESRLKFFFNEQYWNNVIQFDEHPDYKKIKEALSGTKGVDFLGVLGENVYFIEVKNFKDYRIKNKERLKNIGEDLMIEVAQKVRDSLACIISGKLNSTRHKILWNNYLKKIINDNKVIKVVLWLETDNIPNNINNIRGKNKQSRNTVSIATYKQKLQSKLKWLVPTKANVTILNTGNYETNDLAFKVNYLQNDKN